jgi:hypothetical protein
VSDGTASGTTMVKDVVTGTLGSFPSMLTVFSPRPEIAEKVYFFVKSDQGYVFGTGGHAVRLHACTFLVGKRSVFMCWRAFLGVSVVGH